MHEQLASNILSLFEYIVILLFSYHFYCIFNILFIDETKEDNRTIVKRLGMENKSELCVLMKAKLIQVLKKKYT